MKVRLNFIKESELRYQGAVSHRFIAQVSLTAGGTICLILLGLAFLYVRNTKVNLRWAEEEWAELERDYKAVQTMDSDLQSNKLLINELQGWENSKFDIGMFLTELRLLVPKEIQLKRIGIQHVVEEVEPEGAAPGAPKVPTRVYDIMVEGRSEGERPDDTVVQFMRSIRGASAFEGLFDTVRLQRMQRIDDPNNPEGARTFGIQIAVLPKGMQ